MYYARFTLSGGSFKTSVATLWSLLTVSPVTDWTEALQNQGPFENDSSCNVCSGHRVGIFAHDLSHSIDKLPSNVLWPHWSTISGLSADSEVRLTETGCKRQPDELMARLYHIDRVHCELIRGRLRDFALECEQMQWPCTARSWLNLTYGVRLMKTFNPRSARNIRDNKYVFS